MDKIKNVKQGFTLLELLVVVLIIGILAGIALPRYQRVKEKAIMTEGMQIVKKIAEANQRYYLIHSEYADDMSGLDIEFSGDEVILGGAKRIETNNFIVSTHGSEEGEMAVAQRKPIYNRYYIRILIANPNSFDCNTYTNSTNIQRELCNKLNSNGHI